jgi:hypothetical protein
MKMNNIWEPLCCYKNQIPKEMDGNSTKESNLCLTRSQILFNRVKSIKNQGYEPPPMWNYLLMCASHVIMA